MPRGSRTPRPAPARGSHSPRARRRRLPGAQDADVVDLKRFTDGLHRALDHLGELRRLQRVKAQVRSHRLLPRTLGHFLGGTLELAEVARDLGEADQHAVAISRRAQHDVGPEARAILPDAPALFLETALGAGDLELAFRLSCADLLRRVEAGEVLPDNLLRAVSLDVLGPPVPGCHPALAIEHEDGVVLLPLKQQAPPLLARG